MDFDDLDDAEAEAGVGVPDSGVVQPELIAILQDTGTPEGFKQFLLGEDLNTCAKVSAYILATDDEEFRKECDKLAAKLSPPAETTREQIAIRNAVRRCRKEAEPPQQSPAPATAPTTAPTAPAAPTAAPAAPEPSVPAVESEPSRPCAWDGGDGSEPYRSYMDSYLERLYAGQVTGEAPGRPEPEAHWRVDKDFEEHRKVAEANWQVLSSQGVKPLSPFRKLTMGDLEKLCSKVVEGEMYGLPVPVNLDDLKRRGERYLTQAFRAAGTIGADNSVKRIIDFKRLPMTGKEAAGGSGPKAFLTVQYERDEPGLHLQLFCKMPWDMGSTSLKVTGNDSLSAKEQEQFYKLKEKGIDPYYRWKCSATADYEAQEATIYRFLGPIFPFKIPKYYFADICRENTNYILITEKIAYPKKGQAPTNPQPYEILPVAEKYFDFQLQPRMQYEMYYCIMRAQARMAAWDKLHYFDVAPAEMRGIGMAPPWVGTFEFPQRLPEKRRAAKIRGGEGVAKLWTEFLTDKGKRLYDPKFQHKDFLEALTTCAKGYTGYKDDVFLYSCLFPEMIALQHVNLQSDNAYYWYNSEDEMDTGLIDWGGASPGSFAMRMAGSITSALGAVLDEHEEGFLRCFIDEYYMECGIKLDYGELRRQWMLCYCNYIYSMGSNIEMEIFRETPRDMWKDITSKWDDKAAGRWNVRCYVFMTEHALEYLYRRWERTGKRQLHCYSIFLEWKEYWEAKGMT